LLNRNSLIVLVLGIDVGTAGKLFVDLQPKPLDDWCNAIQKRTSTRGGDLLIQSHNCGKFAAKYCAFRSGAFPGRTAYDLGGNLAFSANFCGFRGSRASAGARVVNSVLA
jgi:hypothetical protein